MSSENSATDREDAGAAAFADYFRRNYPGPDTIIGNPDWHAPRIYSAAVRAYEQHRRADLCAAERGVTPTDNTALVDATKELLAGMVETYRARNNRQVSIQADDGEKCWIVHSDLTHALQCALDAALASREAPPTDDTALVEGECPTCGALPCDQVNEPSIAGRSELAEAKRHVDAICIGLASPIHGEDPYGWLERAQAAQRALSAALASRAAPPEAQVTVAGLTRAIPAEGDTIDRMRANLWVTPEGRTLMNSGDVRLYWLNEGDVNTAALRALGGSN